MIQRNNKYPEVIAARLNRSSFEMLAEIHDKTGGTNSSIVSCAIDYITLRCKDDFMAYLENNIDFKLKGYNIKTENIENGDK